MKIENLKKASDLLKEKEDLIIQYDKLNSSRSEKINFFGLYIEDINIVGFSLENYSELSQTLQKVVLEFLMKRIDEIDKQIEEL